MLRNILIVGIGGFAGTILRYLISKYFTVNFTTEFPWGTFLVNIFGSLFIGIFFGIFEGGNKMTYDWFLFLTIGVCGGFTTFSTFSNESFILLKNNRYWLFASYAFFSFILGIFAIVFGRYLAKLFLR